MSPIDFPKYNDLGTLVVPKTMEVEAALEYVNNAVVCLKQNEVEMALSWLVSISHGYSSKLGDF